MDRILPGLEPVNEGQLVAPRLAGGKSIVDGASVVEAAA